MASDGETWCANDPNFAVIYSFLKVFGKLYGLVVPTIAKLQESIEDTQEVSDTLKELHLRLLRRALKTVHSNRWEKGMIKFCHQQGHHQEAWEIERFSYKKASTQVKLKVLKILLEYQFTCHPKFKAAVNAISCKELRLDPIGQDQNGCSYWLQVDDDANICLYKEDQDEETWQLIARNREELVKVIGQLKSGEEISPSQTSHANEDSSGAENQAQESQTKVDSQPQKPEVEDEENDEEFLSPESESEHDETEHKDPLSDPVDENETNVKSPDLLQSIDTKIESSVEPVIKEKISENCADNDKKDVETEKQTENDNIQAENDNEKGVEESEATTNNIIEQSEEELLRSPEPEKSEESEDKIVSADKIIDSQADDLTETDKIEENSSDPLPENKTIATDPGLNVKTSEENPISPKPSESLQDSGNSLTDDKDSTDNKSTMHQEKCEEKLLDEEVSEAIEEPVMVVTGEGSGTDCESYFIGEEISEPVMFFYGEGYGYENDTGNPEAIEETNETKEKEEIGKEEVVNGEHDVVRTKTKLSKSIRLKNVNKRSLKKQSNDTNDAKPDTKKPCVRDTDKSHNSNVENCLKREVNVNEKSTTDSESPRKNSVKKGRSKVKKKAVTRKLKRNGKDAINSVETDNCQDKTSIIEKRKSSVSSVDQEDNPVENEKEKTPDKELKVEDPLPTKKLRLETSPESDINATHSKDVVSDSIEKDNSNHDPISKRKKIKASKGKFKRKAQANQDLDKNNDIDKVNDSPKKSNKSLKRTLIAEPMSDKNKSESQSESEDDEPVTSGKRLKIKPKKIITSSRKKVEAKLLEKHSSDESEEETLYSLAGKKSTKKLVKKKPKGKSKDKGKKVKAKSEKANSSDSDAPVRQSRRIAQQKIKEEAERRHLEEVALRELKMIHKKKTKDDDEEEWRASGRSSSEAETKRKQRRTWHASDSTGPEPDSESDSPLFELHHDAEPEHDYGKSDHEFSPESDLESGESSEPLKRARTLQEEKDDGFCKRCGKAEQPEWILLCDGCDAGYHASCLKPVLLVVPEGDWFCPPCNHDKLIKALENELVKYDELLVKVEEERARKKLEEPEPAPVEEKKEKSEDDSDGSSASSWSSSSGDAAVYRLRARRQLPVSVRSQEYDRIISAAIKEEYVEPTTSAGNQGRGKDISTIIEAAEEEKLKAEREAIEQGKPIEAMKKVKKKQRRKPRKLNSLEVPSEDDDETDEDFKDVGGASSSEDISSSADRDSGDSRSSDSLPIRRTARTDRKERSKMTESSPETKKKKKIFEDSSSESAGAKEWNTSAKHKSKSHSRPKKRDKRDRRERRDKSKKWRSRGLTQYDAEGNVIRARVTYGGLSGGEGDNDWSPKHRTRQKKINYTEMPNTESEDEMHKSSGKHMPDSSDEFKCSDSEFDSDSDSDRTKKRKEEENAEREKALSELTKKTAVVPLEKLPEDVTKAKTEELQAHLNAQQASARPARGKGSRGGRGSRGPRGRGGARAGGRASSPQTDDALAKLVGVKIKELGQDGSPVKAGQLEREKKRQEREAKQAEKEARKLERLQKKEEKEKLKEMKAKEREEKKLARLAMQETKRIKKEKEYMGGVGGFGVPVRPLGAESPRINNMNMNMMNHMRPARPPGAPGAPGPPGAPGAADGAERYPNTPRLQVRAELRGVAGEHRPGLTREGTLSVAGSPQPYKPVSEEPSIITRMPHMINQQYRGPMMYGPSGAAGGSYPARQPAPGGVYGIHGLRYPPHYYRLPYSGPAAPHQLYQHLQGPGGPPSSMHPNQGSLHHSGGYYRPGPPGAPGPSSSPASSPMPTPGPHMPGPQHHMGPHNIPGGPFLPRSPGPNPSPSGAPTPPSAGPGPQLVRPLAPAGPLGGPPPAGPETEPPIRIKAEVKTEPEYRSPVASPGAGSPGAGEAREEPPRHPKIKVTEVRERRPRFPLGPYAPHLAPYRPYAPPLHGAPHPGPAGPPGPSLHHPGPPGPGAHHPGPPGPGSHHPGPPVTSAHHAGPPGPQGPAGHHPGLPGPGSHHSGPHHPGLGPHHPGPPHNTGPSPHLGPNPHSGPSPHLGPSGHSAPSPHGPSPHPGQSSHPNVQSPHHPAQSPHNSAPSPHRPGTNSHHPGPSPHHLGPGLHQTGPNSHHPGQSPHQPGSGSSAHQQGPGPHQPGPGPHQPGPGPHQPGPGPHQPGSGPHQPGPGPHQPGPGPHQQGPAAHQPGQSPHPPGPGPHQTGQGSHHTGSANMPGAGPHQPGANAHSSGPQPHRPGQSPQRPGQSPQHPGPGPHHPGPAPHHPAQSSNHPGPTPLHQAPSPHALLRDPSQFKTERDESPPPGGAEDRSYPAGRGYPPGVRSPFPPGYPGARPYPAATAGGFPPGGPPYAGPGFPGARFPPAARGFPAGSRPFPPQFPPRSPHAGPLQPPPASPQPAPARSPLAAPPRAPAPGPAHVKPAGRGSMPFPARTSSPGAPPMFAARAPSPREPKPRSPPDRSPPYYPERRGPPPPDEAGSPAGLPRRRLESLEAAPSPGAESPPRVKVEREEGGVFGGLVSYFSSQHEDDMDG